MNIKDIKAWDIHSHFNHGSPYDSDHTPVYNATIEKIEEMNVAGNVEKIFLSTFAAVLYNPPVEEENEYLFHLARQYDRFYQWVVIDPTNKNTYTQAKNMLYKGKCVGIKLHPECHGYRIADYGDELFTFASDFNATVEIHPGATPTYIVPFADRYPRVNFIMAHMCEAAFADAILNAKHHNVYADTSGSASINNNVVECVVNRAGADRILFGTDTYDVGFQRGRIEYARISDEDKYRILRGNAEDLLGDIVKKLG